MEKVIQEIATYQKKEPFGGISIINKTSFYLRILKAYRNEILRLCEDNAKAAEKLLSYFFGSKDFYKVIMLEKENVVKIEAFNMHSSLGKKAGGVEHFYETS